MALTWDVSEVDESVRLGPRFENGEEYEGLSVLTETLIFATMMLGIGRFTEKNAAEVYARLSVYEALHGTLVSTMTDDGPKPRPITVQDVLDHIGLRTNAAFEDETRARWMKRLVGSALDDRLRPVRDAQRSLQTT